jgi:hypothetical protein
MSDGNFIYLDGDIERQQLVGQVRDVRVMVLTLAAQLPEKHHYQPRYSGLSLAQVLARLLAFDTTTFWLVRAASNNYAVRLPKSLMRVGDAGLSYLFKRRLVEASVRGIRRKETEICSFIRDVPMEALSHDVLHPGVKEPYTVERALQIYFVHHWHEQLQQIQAVEGVTGTP